MSLSPIAEQIVDHRVQPALGGIPWLEQVVVQADLVDRRDRHVGVGVGGQQQELRVRRMRAGPREHLDARHPRHPLISDDQCHLLAAQRQRRQHSEGLRSGLRADHAVVGPILP
ncbi:MAG TPA: hypothetical protein VFZ70_09130 [Euzebyales bacterium]